MCACNKELVFIIFLFAISSLNIYQNQVCRQAREDGDGLWTRRSPDCEPLKLSHENFVMFKDIYTYIYTDVHKSKSESDDGQSQFKFNHHSPSPAHLIGALKNYLIKFQTNLNRVFKKLPLNFLIHQPTSDHRGEDITHFALLRQSALEVASKNKKGLNVYFHISKWQHTGN